MSAGNPRSTEAGVPRTLRAQSEVVGVLLFTGVVVVLIGVASTFLLSGIDTTAEPVADVEVQVTDSTVRLTHGGGDSLATAAVRVEFGRDGGGATTLADATDVAGDGDDRFEPGERRETGHGASDTISVTVVHDPSDTVVARVVRDVPDLD